MHHTRLKLYYSYANIIKTAAHASASVFFAIHEPRASDASGLATKSSKKRMRACASRLGDWFKSPISHNLVAWIKLSKFRANILGETLTWAVIMNNVRAWTRGQLNLIKKIHSVKKKKIFIILIQKETIIILNIIVIKWSAKLILEKCKK